MTLIDRLLTDDRRVVEALTLLLPSAALMPAARRSRRSFRCPDHKAQLSVQIGIWSELNDGSRRTGIEAAESATADSNQEKGLAREAGVGCVTSNGAARSTAAVLSNASDSFRFRYGGLSLCFFRSLSARHGA